MPCAPVASKDFLTPSKDLIPLQSTVSSFSILSISDANSLNTSTCLGYGGMQGEREEGRDPRGEGRREGGKEGGRGRWMEQERGKRNEGKRERMKQGEGSRKRRERWME